MCWSNVWSDKMDHSLIGTLRYLRLDFLRSFLVVEFQCPSRSQPVENQSGEIS